MTDSTQSRHRVADIVREAQVLLNRLYHAVREGQATEGDFYESRTIVESLPLSTAEFGLAACRLGNAARYYSQGEAGAAAFELKLAQRSLQKTGQ